MWVDTLIFHIWEKNVSMYVCSLAISHAACNVYQWITEHCSPPPPPLKKDLHFKQCGSLQVAWRGVLFLSYSEQMHVKRWKALHSPGHWEDDLNVFSRRRSQNIGPWLIYIHLCGVCLLVMVLDWWQNLRFIHGLNRWRPKLLQGVHRPWKKTSV